MVAIKKNVSFSQFLLAFFVNLVFMSAVHCSSSILLLMLELNHGILTYRSNRGNNSGISWKVENLTIIHINNVLIDNSTLLAFAYIPFQHAAAVQFKKQNVLH